MFVEIECPSCEADLVLDMCIYDIKTWDSTSNYRAAIKTVEIKRDWLQKVAANIASDLEGCYEVSVDYLLYKLSKIGIEGSLAYDVLEVIKDMAGLYEPEAGILKKVC